jgi:hypothetical protein
MGTGFAARIEFPSKEHPMGPLLFIGAAALGGAAMYYFDPETGRRRRALARDQAAKASSNVRHFVDDGTRDLKTRGSALTGRVKSLVSRRKGTDEVLAERVRSKMGRHVLHPGAIEVSASGGKVTLSGSILAHEHDDLLEALGKVPGVVDIVDEIGVYETAEGISELQGGRESRGSHPANWAPGTRLIGSAAGTTLTLYAIARSNRFAGFVALMTGVGLLARAVSNKPLLRLAGLEASERPTTQTTLVEDSAAFETRAPSDRFPEDTALRGSASSPAPYGPLTPPAHPSGDQRDTSRSGA